MALQRKKDGTPNTKFFESVETVALFDPVRSWLLKNCKKVFIQLYLFVKICLNYAMSAISEFKRAPGS